MLVAFRLRPDFCCGIHDNLRKGGFPGCTAYGCLGAGQKVTQVAFAGQDWRRAPRMAEQMFEVFAIMRQLHPRLLARRAGNDRTVTHAGRDSGMSLPTPAKQ